MNSVQGMYMNGPMAGRIIDLPEDPPQKMSVAVNLIRCGHGGEGQAMTVLTYSINKPLNDRLPYVITLDSNFDDVGWYCPQCKAEAEVKYKLNEIKRLLDNEKEDDDE